MKKLKYLLFISPLFLLGCFGGGPQTPNVYVPRPVNANVVGYEQVNKYLDLKMKKMINMAENNFIQRTIATNAMDLGTRTLYYKSFRIFKYEKIKHDPIADAFNYPNKPLITKDKINQKNLLNQGLISLSVVSFKNKIKNFLIRGGSFKIILTSNGNIYDPNSLPKDKYAIYSFKLLKNKIYIYLNGKLIKQKQIKGNSVAIQLYGNVFIFSFK